MRKLWFNYFVYLSLIFLLYALYRMNYLKIPEIRSYLTLSFSFFILFCGFIFWSICWQKVLIRQGYRVSVPDSFASSGLLIFGKYIPGKIWTIVGRASYIAEKTSSPLARLSALSLSTEFISLWSGFLLGIFGIFMSGQLHIYMWFFLFLWLGLSIVVFTGMFHKPLEYLLKKIFKKTISIPRLSLKSTFYVLPWFFFYWLLYAVGFYLLVISISGQPTGLYVGLAFPLSAVLGIMAIFIPGGLGVREGIITGALKISGLSLAEAVSISVAARLWFMVGEGFIFITALVSGRSGKGEAKEKLKNNSL